MHLKDKVGIIFFLLSINTMKRPKYECVSLSLSTFWLTSPLAPTEDVNSYRLLYIYFIIFINNRTSLLIRRGKWVFTAAGCCMCSWVIINFSVCVCVFLVIKEHVTHCNAHFCYFNNGTPWHRTMRYIRVWIHRQYLLEGSFHCRFCWQ